MDPFMIKTVGPEYAEIVGTFVWKLEDELSDGQAVFPLDEIIEAAKNVMTTYGERYIVLAAFHGEEPVGIMTVCEKLALYSLGRIGEIMEFYVKPEFRSSGIGQRLMDRVVILGKVKRWESIEVGAPPQPKWEKTLRFYERQGFTDIGPRLELELDVT